MSDVSKHLNPWLLHHQKLGLELKCPLCLNLLHRPMLLPCNHIFCNFCVPRSTQFGSECPVCKQQYSGQDVRPAPYMENLVTIYRSLDATVGTDLFQPLTPDAVNVLQESPVSFNGHVDNELKVSVESPQEGNSSNGQPAFLLTAKKRVRASLNCSLEEENKLTRKSEKSTPPTSGNQEGFKMNDNGMGLTGMAKLISSHFPGHMKGAKDAKLGIEKSDMNQVLRSSPSSSTSVATKGVDDDCSGPGSSNDSIRNHPAKNLVENNADQAGCERKDRVSPDNGEVCFQDAKRQKKVNNGLFDGCGTSSRCTQPKGSCSERVATLRPESKLGKFSCAKAPEILDSFDANKSKCAFCHSSGVTDRTGLMLHYVNGKEVVGDAATNANVIHVHKTCIEWTPQVYFVDETVKNLKEEVGRAAKLKCSHCGLRGASLGCFMKSCRKSYHVPCAVEIPSCKWDTEDFLMLCPSHSSVKFPREKLKSRKCASEKQHPVPTGITSKPLCSSEVSPNDSKPLVFCGSALSSEEKLLLVKFASFCGAAVTKFWKPNVTHVIAATDSNGAYIRTLKVLKAILNGRWILKTDWLKASMEAMHPVDEEPYEVCLDNHGCCGGPKIGRHRAMDNAPKLFTGLNFYFTGDFIPCYKEDLLDLVISAGGTIIKSKEHCLAAQNHVDQTTPPVTLVVYNNDHMSEEEVSVVLQRLEAAVNLGKEIGCKVIAHTWLLESIAACMLKPFDY